MLGSYSEVIPVEPALGPLAALKISFCKELITSINPFMLKLARIDSLIFNWTLTDTPFFSSLSPALNQVHLQSQA